MFKMIFLVLGLAVGFGGGVYWAHHNPERAAKVSAEEEKQFLKAQLEINRRIQTKLDQLTSKASGKSPGTGFLSSGQAGGGALAAEVNDVKSDTQKQQDELQKRLAALK